MSLRPIQCVVLLALLATRGLAGGLDPTAVFEQGRTAYEQGDYVQARTCYSQLLDAGFDAPEVHFNLGNTLFRIGQPGRAIAHYRRAQYARPRDADIRANLAIVQQQVGALRSEATPWQTIAGHLSQAEWLRLLAAGYWLAASLGTAYLLMGRHVWLLRGAGLGLIVVLLAAAGWWHWHLLVKQPEAVVIQGEVQALFAPLESAMPHFALPEGSLVRVIDQSGRWLKIQVGRQEGWLAATTCERISHRP